MTGRRGIDPVKGLRGDRQIVGLLCNRPVLEGSAGHADERVRRQPHPRHGDQVRAEVKRVDVKAETGQRLGELSGAAPDLPDRNRGRAIQSIGDSLDDLIRIAGADNTSQAQPFGSRPVVARLTA